MTWRTYNYFRVKYKKQYCWWLKRSLLVREIKRVNLAHKIGLWGMECSGGGHWESSAMDCVLEPAWSLRGQTKCFTDSDLSPQRQTGSVRKPKLYWCAFKAQWTVMICTIQGFKSKAPITCADATSRKNNLVQVGADDNHSSSHSELRDWVFLAWL